MMKYLSRLVRGIIEYYFVIIVLFGGLILTAQIQKQDFDAEYAELQQTLDRIKLKIALSTEELNKN